MHTYDVEYTDTFGGEANYCWVRHYTITMPELTHYGYAESTDGSYFKAKRAYNRRLMVLAKAACGLTGVRGRKEDYGDMVAFYPNGKATVMFITWRDE